MFACVVSHGGISLALRTRVTHCLWEKPLSLRDSHTLLEDSPLRQTTGAHMECLPASVSFQKLSALNTLLACRHVLESALTVTYISCILTTVVRNRAALQSQLPNGLYRSQGLQYPGLIWIFYFKYTIQPLTIPLSLSPLSSNMSST